MDRNGLIISDETPDILSLSNTDAIGLIGRLFLSPVMQSLIRLSPHSSKSMNYLYSHNLLDICSDYSTEEEYEEERIRFHERFPDGIVCFDNDILAVSDALNSLDELRILALEGLITREAAREIFANMINQEKTSLQELTLEDSAMLGYDELAMQSLMQSGVAVLTFDTGLADTITEILAKKAA